MTKRHLESVKPVQAAQPYAFSARHYFNAGWSPLPLPPGEKSYPPTGYTGGKGRNAEPEKVEYWIQTKPDGNVALRMPPTLIGIDVDAYSGKDGAATLASAEEAWGELPPTWRTTSRTDGVSGIRLFRIPEGLLWPGQLPFGGGVELCRWDHRYVIVAPSIHDKTADQYHWFAPDGTQTTGTAVEDGDWEFPALDELATLPEAWVTGLTSGKKWVEREEEDLDPEEVAQWILDRPDGDMCSKMERTLDTWMAKVSAAGEDGGAHDSTRDAVWSVLRDAAAGHSGATHALRKLMLAHKEALRLRRPQAAASEWASMKARGVRKVAAEGPTDDDDPCVMGETTRAPRTRNRGSADMDYTRDDTGNGRRFAMQWRDEVRYVPEYKGWMVWKESTWAPDEDGEVNRMAVKAVDDIEKEVDYLEDVKAKSALRKFITSSRNVTKLDAMLKAARSNKGMTVPATQFNSNRAHLVCANGTLVLPSEFSGERVRLLPSLQEHFNTIQTSVRYVENARLPEWEKFLERFQPDVEIREWLQKLAGYSLLGRNPRRIMAVAFGKTSTGKTTFAEAVKNSLGEYAVATSMTVFRDNQDERPRPDLVRLLHQRFAYAEEASASWHLHPDQIKRLTGGSPIQARVPYAEKYLSIVPAFTPWLLTNSAPTIEGADAALWRRLLVVPFAVQIPANEEDVRVHDALVGTAGQEAVLAWLVEGYRMYLAEPDSLQVIPAGALAANEEFRATVSDLAQCLSDIAETGSEDFHEAPAKLYMAYRTWCESKHIKDKDIMSDTKFGRELNGMGHDKRSMRIDGKPVYHRIGIRLAPDWVKMTAGA